MTRPTPPVPIGAGYKHAVERQLAALSNHDPPELRVLWRRHYGISPPKGLSRDMLLRAIAYKTQEKAFGGLTKSTRRRLAALVHSLNGPATHCLDPYPSLKPGTRLVREWSGTTHTVLVLDDGFEYDGQRYPSLTKLGAMR
jgi:Protein of unknown function (DUF2924)